MKRLFILILIPLLLAGCQAKTTAVAVPENFQEISQPMAENIFTSLENDDYESFHKDFAEKMLAATSADTFQTLRESILQSLGNYQSMEYDQTNYEEGYFISYFNLQFSDGMVTVYLVLNTEEPYLVEGFWFPDFPSE